MEHVRDCQEKLYKDERELKGEDLEEIRRMKILRVKEGDGACG